MCKTGNGLLKAIFQSMSGESRPGKWVRQLREHMRELEISFDRSESMTKLELDRVVDRWEINKWRKNLESRTTLRLFRIGEDGIYRNVFGSVLMIRCRTNTLRLRWNDGFSGGAVDCLLRGAEEETVEHFVMKCEVIRMIRERH